MSFNIPGEQVEHAFSSHRLCNWEAPRNRGKTTAETRFDTLKPKTGKTEFIVDDRGYVIESSGTKKMYTSFNHQPHVYEKTFARWPQPNPAIPMYQTATMGYKGIKTSYLPTNTVLVKAVESPQVTKPDGLVPGKYTGEYNYNFS